MSPCKLGIGLGMCNIKPTVKINELFKSEHWGKKLTKFMVIKLRNEIQFNFANKEKEILVHFGHDGFLYLYISQFR